MAHLGMTAGVGLAGFIGALFAAGLEGSAAEFQSTSVVLASFDSRRAPEAPASVDPWWLDTGGSLVGVGFAPAPTGLSLGGYNLFQPFGNGGWLIGNGLDALADCTGAACNGGDGGL